MAFNSEAVGSRAEPSWRLRSGQISIQRRVTPVSVQVATTSGRDLTTAWK